MRRNTIGIAAATLAAAGAIGVAGAALASAADNTTATPSPTATSAAPGGTNPGGGASPDTAVTGSEADKVIAAVKAKDSGVTITTVRKDPDGSYDAIGTKSGSPVFYDVSADLKTITAATGRAGGHGGASDGTGTVPGQSSATSNTTSNPTDANGATAV